MSSENPEISVESADDSFLRLQAEFANFKKRSQKHLEENSLVVSYTLLQAFIPLLDDFALAEKHGELTGGFKSVADNFRKLLQDLGVITFGNKGDKFDPSLHEAISLVYSDTPELVQDVIAVGYLYNGKVLRHAKVTVGSDEQKQ